MRKQTIMVMLLAVLCGTSAAFGVHQLLKARTQPQAVPAEVKTKPVVAAAQKIERTTKIDANHLKVTEWPEEFVPPNVYSKVDEVVGKFATSDLEAGSPIFAANLSDKAGGGFASSIIQGGMRGYTIETSGASASVAGLVRPGDFVDVLLTLRSSKEDHLGGGTTIPLLEGIQIIAINQITDLNPDRFTMLLSGSQVTSVTLQVTLDEAMLLGLCQDAGELSLALRTPDEPDEPSKQMMPRSAIEQPTMAAISKAVKAKDKSSKSIGGVSVVEPAVFNSATTQSNDESLGAPRPPSKESVTYKPGYIRTSRAGQPGRIPIRLSR